MTDHEYATLLPELEAERTKAIRTADIRDLEWEPADQPDRDWRDFYEREYFSWPWGAYRGEDTDGVGVRVKGYLLREGDVVPCMGIAVTDEYPDDAIDPHLLMGELPDEDHPEDDDWF